MGSRQIQFGEVLWSSSASAWSFEDGQEVATDQINFEELMMGTGFASGVAAVLVNRAADVTRRTGECGAELLAVEPTAFMLMSPAERTEVEYSGRYPDDIMPGDFVDSDSLSGLM